MAELPSTPPLTLDELDLKEGQLSEELLETLRTLTAPERVCTDAFERAFHAVGKSYYDMIRIRSGRLSVAPDAVVYPDTHEEVLAILAACAEAKVAVVPFGGGSSVVGGVEARGGPAHAGIVTLDTTRMDRLIEIDEISHTATFEAGIYGPALEEKLASRGYTLGHFPQSFEFSTLGGWIAARGAGQQSNRYGAAAKLLVGAKMATPTGEWVTKVFPSSAAGPNLNQVIAGSEGALGVITEATVKIHRIAEKRDFVSFLFKNWSSGAEAVRSITQAELPIATLRLSDVDETHFYSGFKSILKPSKVQDVALKALGAGGFDEPCVLMVGFEGSASAVRLAWRSAFALAAKCGGLYVGRGPGNAWYEKRFEMPYLRDPLMDRGVGLDTLETSTTWSNVDRLYGAVTSAIRGALEKSGHPGIVLAHMSHTYIAGTSLYFTFLFPRDLDNEVAQWQAVKDAASDAISENGGTISHHHGVGADHVRWLPAELGELGIGMLSAAKDRLDPAGIMNPGKLLPEG